MPTSHSSTVENYNTGDVVFQEIREFTGPFEIVSLVGTLSGDQGHLHISLSDAQGHMIGGHVVGGLYVFTTAEIVIGECSDLTFTREYDDCTGFLELVIKNNAG